MNYEKKYKEALERAEKALEVFGTDKCEGARQIFSLFPELKESEDEKIRKRIIHALHGDVLDMEETAKAIAWLEKQGKPTEISPSEFDLHLNKLLKQFESLPKEELISNLSYYLNVIQNDGTYKIEKQSEQKPADKIEPKFHEGDWITDGEAVFHITSYDIDYGYQLETPKGTLFHFSDENVENKYHLWSIEDAKDGDVLVYHNTATEIIMLFKSWFMDMASAYTHFHIFSNYFRVNDNCDCGNGAHPATKEQRDLLFQKMKEEGYEWDANKNELKLLITNGGDFESENCEQKSAWSEEDEEMLSEIITDIKSAQSKYPDSQMNQIIIEEEVNWLKTIKQRIGG